MHFDDSQVYWVCNSTVANEVWPRGWLDTHFENRVRRLLDGYWLTKPNNMPDNKVTLNHMNVMWKAAPVN